MRKIRIALMVVLIVATAIVPYSFATGTDNEQCIYYTGTVDISQPDNNHVYFGSYPQTEIVSSIEQCGTYGRSFFQISDCIIDPELYSALENATWSSNKATVNGEMYRRAKKGNAAQYSDTNVNFYNWSDATTYHYFRYEPLKWSILKITEKDAFLLCDNVIDHYVFKNDNYFTYNSSSIRTWLNGTFYNNAFNEIEKAAINRTNVSNSDGSITKDKVFLLSVEEVSGEEGAEYGFASDPEENDASRIKKSSTYAKAMGSYANAYWWLRTTVDVTDTSMSAGYHSTACIVQSNGALYGGGQTGYTGRTTNGKVNEGICPAIHIKLDSNSPIVAKSSYDEMSLSQSTYSFDGTKKEPTVTIGGLVAGTDYELSYNNSIGPGIATVTASGIGNYSGSIKAEYKIGYNLPAANEFVLSTDSYTYDGNEKCPSITADGLEEGTDFEVRYSNNVEAGTATAIVEGVGNYLGTRSLSYTIQKLDISTVDVCLNASHYIYSGEAIEPTVVVNGLEQGKDYSVYYSSNTSVGSGTITVAGIGSCTGAAYISFDIHDELERTEAVAATCITDGHREYWTCSCGKYFSDANGNNEIEENSWVEPAKGHTYGDWTVTKEATCTEDGSKEKVCSACEDKVIETIPAKGHTWNEEYTIDKEATCTEEGSQSRHCANCDEVADVSVIPANGHMFAESFTVDKEATCTEEGSKSRHCVNCDEGTDVTAIPKIDHPYGDWTVTKEATCTEDGSKEKVCSACEDKVIETIPATGHQWNEEYTIDKEATCTEEGSKSIRCSVCNAIDESTVEAIPKADHNYGEWKVTKEATCTEDGSKEKVCSVCGDKVTETIPATGHQWNEEYTVDKEATCTEEGRQSRHCANCDEVTDVTAIPANGHSFGAWEEITPSTCVDSGIQKHTCTICGFTETENLDPSGHEWEDDITVDVAPTCTEDGSKSRHCKNCDAVTDSEVIPATGHNGEWKTVKEPTCTEAGTKEMTCTVCGTKLTEEIPAKGHSWNSEPTVDKAATCTKAGSQSTHCARCDEIKDAEVIPALGHNWNASPTVDKVATCTEEGSESIHCARCDEIKAGTKTSIPAKGHSFTAWTTTKVATEIATGEQSHKCSVCGKTETKTIAQLAPTLPAVKITKPKAAKKSATIKWKKVSKANKKKIASIQIQYSMDKTFKTGVKTVTAKKSAASKKISKLTSKKTYYVRIRAYKKDAKGVHVSKWSAVKSVKAK